MTWALIVDRRAERELAALDPIIYRRVKNAILKLADQPRPQGIKKLRGPSEDGWRIRVGDWRVILKIDDAHRTVFVLHVYHRSRAYR